MTLDGLKCPSCQHRKVTLIGKSFCPPIAREENENRMIGWVYLEKLEQP